jgi:hypothetical protein
MKSLVGAIFILAALSEIASFAFSHQTRIEYAWEYAKYIYLQNFASPGPDLTGSTEKTSAPAGGSLCLEYGFRTKNNDCEAPGLSTTKRLLCKGAPAEGEIYCSKRGAG